MTAYSFIWNGSANANWSNSANWTSAGVPTITHDVLVPAGLSAYPVITGPTWVHNLAIQPGAQMTVVAPTWLNVTGDLLNDGRLTILHQAVTTSGANWSIGGYLVVAITPTVHDMGAVTVTLWGNQTCGANGDLANAVKRCYDIAPAVPTTATVRFYYRADELNDNLTDTVQIYHYINSGFWELEAVINRGGSYPWYWVEGLIPAGHYSPFSLKSGLGPTAIALRTFAARPNVPAQPAAQARGIVIAAGLLVLGLAGRHKRRKA